MKLSYSIFLVGSLYASVSSATDRVALVIGEGAYPSQAALTMPIADADAIASTLEQIGFETTEITNAVRADVASALTKFAEQSKGAEVAVLYYAGHGLTLGRQSYLLPTDVRPSSDMLLRFEAIGVDDALAALDGARAKVAFLNTAGGSPYLASMKLNPAAASISNDLVTGRGSDPNLFVSHAQTLSATGEGSSSYAQSVIAALAQPGTTLGTSLQAIESAPTAKNLSGPLEQTARSMLVAPAITAGPVESATTSEPSSNPEDECDRLATNPNDPERSPNVIGIEYWEYLTEDALKACKAAIKLQPNSARFLYQAGRAAMSLNRFDEANDYLTKAQQSGSLQAAVEVGRFIAEGKAGHSRDVVRAMTIFEQAAAEGATDATVALANLYAAGEPGERDITKALALYREAYEKGNATAAESLGNHYTNAATDQDYAEAIMWFKRAAEKGTGAGFNRLGDAFLLGRGVDKNPAMAISMYLKAAGFGATDRAAAIAEMYDFGSGVPANNAEATRWYLKAGAEGEFQIARRYQYGGAIRRTWYDGVMVTNPSNPKGLAEAMIWYTRAAEHGYVRAQWNLGYLYILGEGIEKNVPLAMKWYERAAETGYVPAIKSIAGLYYGGVDIPKDKAMAKVWYLKAVEKGDVDAMTEIASLAASESPPDYRTSLEWYKKAAAKGDRYSEWKLGTYYENGRGTQKDYGEALKWYRKAAERGDWDAMAAIGNFYYFGHTVPQDYTESGRWYEKAAAAGSDYANLSLAVQYSRGQGCRKDSELAAQLAELAVAKDDDARDELKSYWANWTPDFRVAFQKRLLRAGLYKGAVDGRLGSGTMAAIDALAAPE